MDPGIAKEFAAFAERAVFDGDFSDALEAAKLGIEYDPSEWSLKINQAHALMFLGKGSEARSIYLEVRGKKGNVPSILRRVVIRVRRRRSGAISKSFVSGARNHPLMAEIEKLFAASPIVEPAATSPKLR